MNAQIKIHHNSIWPFGHFDRKFLFYASRHLSRLLRIKSECKYNRFCMCSVVVDSRKSLGSENGVHLSLCKMTSTNPNFSENSSQSGNTNYLRFPRVDCKCNGRIKPYPYSSEHVLSEFRRFRKTLLWKKQKRVLCCRIC